MLSPRSYDRIGLPLISFGLVLVAVFLPWRTLYTNLCILITGAIWALNFKTHRHYFSKEITFFILLLCSVYFVEIIGMIYTENTAYGFRRLESKLSLVAFPLIIFASRIEYKHLRFISIAFIISTVVASAVCLIAAFMKIYQKGQPISALFTDIEYTNVDLTEPLQKLHPTFLSLFICLSIYLIVDHLVKYRTRYWLILVCVFLLFMAFQLASRAGLVAVICTLILSGVNVIGMQRRTLLVVYAAIVVSACILAVVFIPTVKTRLVDTVLSASINKEERNSVSYHLKTWTCSFESWLNGHVLFGYGTGDEVDTITQCYHEKRWLGYGHDAHNEFLSSLVKHGILGLSVLLVFFFYPFFLSVKYRDLRYLTFLTITLICFLSESMLRGQTGLVFFTLFNTLLLKEMLMQHNVIKLPDSSPAT